ncbi:MAG: hypothetical protein QOI77_2759 [Blastocatellia bacterium]|jgi:hypothetical protein|nr:hypothetical protein [Blastocatellia bacterium]
MTSQNAPDPKKSRALSYRVRLAPVLVYGWLLVLFLTILISAQSAYRQSLNTEEYPYACDSFGYLRMAKEIRQAAYRRELPQFKLESSQTRLLINFMRSQNLPLPDWEEVVAPHAHHYFPKSGSVGVQYPPGTGLTLAMYPEGKAVYGLNRTVVIVFLAVGVMAFVVAVYRRAWASIVLVVLAIHLGLAVLGRIGALSFSVNAVLIPVLLSVLLALASVKLSFDNRNRLALLSALASGAMVGFATLIRLPTVFLVPGFLILLWPKSWRGATKGLPAIFCAGVFLIGILPVLINQQAVAGAWYLPTYASVDAAPPTLHRLRENFSYFFGEDGPAAQDNWALLYAIAGFAGFAILNYFRRKPESLDRGALSWKRLGLAVLIVWLVPTVFFLMHWVTGAHYAIPGIFGAVALLGFGALVIEVSRRNDPIRFEKRSVLCWLALGLVVAIGLATFNRAWSGRSQMPTPSRAIAHPPVVLPAELTDDHAWVWADLLTGTLWYYDNKPAFKIQFTNPETRALIFKFVFDRGDRQYIIQDNDRMLQFMGEVIQLGGTLEPRGKIDGQLYFLIRWPQGGPLSKNVAPTS